MKEDFAYRTGCTQPPKSSGGMTALLLMVTIFVGGLYSLGFLRSVLLRPIMVTEETVPEVALVQENLDADRNKGRDALSLALSEAPQEGSGTPLSVWSIYQKNIASVVTVTAVYDGVEKTCAGVLLSSQGYLATSGKAVEDAESITVRFHDQSEAKAEPVAADTLTDLAILRTDVGSRVPAEFGNPEALNVAQSVFSMSSEKAVESIVRRPVDTVSYAGRTVSLIRTEGEPGPIGAPLLNSYGQMVGICTCAGGETGYVSGTTVRQVLAELLKNGHVSGSLSLGFSGKTVPLISQIYGNLPAGIYVTQVSRTDGAIQAGDVVTALNDCSTLHMSELEIMLYEQMPGDTVPLTVLRNGELLRLELEVQSK